MTDLERTQSQYSDFLTCFESVILSTLTPQGSPHASYAPFVQDEQRNFYLFISGLAEHTQNLQANPIASLLFIEDEAKSQNIFARRRLTYDCTVGWLQRETDQWEAIANQFQSRLGEMVTLLRSLGDFQIVRLTPQSGRFVIGFGAAYRIEGSALDRLVPLEGKR